MCKHNVLAAIAVLLVSAAALRAQSPAPGAEQNTIGHFLGDWTSEVNVKPGPFGPGGKMTSTDHNEWLPGGFFLAMHSNYKGAMGDGQTLSIMGYDPESKTYTYNSFDSHGMAETSKGTLEGSTWTWLGESSMGGKPMKSRFTIKEALPASYTMKYEMSTDGGTSWSILMEGKATKVK